MRRDRRLALRYLREAETKLRVARLYLDCCRERAEKIRREIELLIKDLT